MKKQPELFHQPKSLAYGGSLRTKRKGRKGARPLATRETMHFVLRSSRAKGEWSFRHSKNKAKIEGILHKFSRKYGVKILSLANVGNHLHLHVQLANRHTYNPFIRAITAAIAMAVTGASRWKKSAEKFWDYRPFSRVIRGWRAVLVLRDYIEVNKMEGLGCSREIAKAKIAWRRAGEAYCLVPSSPGGSHE